MGFFIILPPDFLNFQKYCMHKICFGDKSKHEDMMISWTILYVVIALFVVTSETTQFNEEFRYDELRNIKGNQLSFCQPPQCDLWTVVISHLCLVGIYDIDI